MSAFKFAVVTKTSPHDMAMALDIMVEVAQGTQETGFLPVLKPLHEVLPNPAAIMMMRQPVWTLGEIVVLGSDGREVCGARRKPGKWFVETEEFDTIEEAVTRVMRLANEEREA